MTMLIVRCTTEDGKSWNFRLIRRANDGVASTRFARHSHCVEGERDSLHLHNNGATHAARQISQETVNTRYRLSFFVYNAKCLIGRSSEKRTKVWWT